MINVMIKNIIIGVSLGLLVSSCLDLSPKDQMSDSNMWETASDFKYFANNFYGWTRDFKNVTSDGPHSDARSDLFTGASFNIYSHGSNSIPTSDSWYTNNYKYIRRANLILQNAQNYSREDINTYVGEAYFFRAYFHFDLVQLYGDVIKADKVMDIDSPEMNQKRNDRGEVIDFILDDLNKAVEFLPDEPEEDGRICKMVAYAFMSRVALYEGTWQKFRENTERGKTLLGIAVEAADKVISSKKYELFEPSSLGIYAYKYMFTLENVKSNPAGLTKNDNKEYIFYRRHDEILAPIGTNITAGYCANAVYLNRKLVNMYLTQNGLPIEKDEYEAGTNEKGFKGYGTETSEFENRDNRMLNCMLQKDQKYWKNEDNQCRVTWDENEVGRLTCDVNRGTGYQNQKWCTERQVKSTYEGYDYPIIRYAEVLLNYAEAVYELNDEIEDADLDKSLNLVRLRVNPTMPKLSNALVDEYGLDMQEEIRRERTIELVHEGFRLDDLKRWKTAEEEMPMDIKGIKWEGTDFETSWTGASSIERDDEGCLILESGRTWSEKNYLYPLPSDQIQLNPNLGQNPGWK